MFNTIFSLLILFFVISAQSQQENTECLTQYTTQASDTCETILSRYGLTQQELLTLNPNIQCNNLRGRICVEAKTLRTCVSNSDCRESQFCKILRCSGSGTCERRPTICTLENLPVCGCDGRSYSTECVAFSSGASVLKAGECKPEEVLANDERNLTNICNQTYTIRHGDTCARIWTKNHIHEIQFFRINPDLNCSNLQLGQQICLSDNSQEENITTIFHCQTKYRIGDDDTCVSIWSSQFVSSEVFFLLNPAIDCDYLQVGQEVCVAIIPLLDRHIDGTLHNLVEDLNGDENDHNHEENDHSHEENDHSYEENDHDHDCSDIDTFQLGPNRVVVITEDKLSYQEAVEFCQKCSLKLAELNTNEVTTLKNSGILRDSYWIGSYEDRGHRTPFTTLSMNPFIVSVRRRTQPIKAICESDIK